MTQTLLVAGAAGQLGRRVVDYLLKMNTGPIIATTRDPSKLADLASKGVDVRLADYDKPETLGAAFAGADRMLLISTGAIFVPDLRLAQQRAAVSAAAKAGVKHVLYTSIASPRPNKDSTIDNDHFWTEQAIAESGMSWTFMRHGLYTDGLAWSIPQALQSGVWATATAGRPRHWVTRDDCAHADAVALASDDTEPRIYEITGPAALSVPEAAAIISDVTGLPLRHQDISVAALREGLTAAGLPPTLIGAMTGFDIATSLGFYASVTPDVEDLTGRAPMALRDWVVANRDVLVPPVAA